MKTRKKERRGKERGVDDSQNKENRQGQGKEKRGEEEEGLLWLREIRGRVRWEATDVEYLRRMKWVDNRTITSQRRRRLVTAVVVVAGATACSVMALMSCRHPRRSPAGL